ncbi:MAG: T9SS type A sorting domain-containing protein [Flavobacteriales bacterium]|nr:T9SS type A sorting domain-containing protein [Flavobacteriales bacterium]
MSAQPAIEWQKCLGGTGTEFLYDLAKAADGGYYVAGGTTSYDGDVTGYHGGGIPPYPDIWVVKLDSTSTIEWQKCLGGTNEERAYAITGASDGGCLTVGYTWSNDGDVVGNHGSDAWVVRLDAAGGLVAQHFIGGAGGDVGRAIQGTSDGGFALAGSTSSNDGDFSGNHGGVDGWVAKLDADAAVQWQHCYGGSALDELWSVQQTNDGGYVVAGRTYSNDGDVSGHHGSMDAWVLKLDGAGTILWQKCMGGNGDDEFRSAQQTSDGGFILAGSTGSNDGDVIGYHGDNDAWVVKLSANGDLQWQKSLGGSQGDGGNAVRQTTDGGFILTGGTTSNDGDVSGFHQGFGVSDAWVVKLNDVGTLEWQKCLGGTSPESAHAIEETSAQHYVMAGYAWSNDGDVSGNHGGFDGWVVKLGLGEVGVVEEPRTPFTITPNPTRSTLTITLPRGPSVPEIVLMDATGRTVMTQPTATSTASLTLDLAGQESGMYLVQLRFADGTRAVERVVKE